MEDEMEVGTPVVGYNIGFCPMSENVLTKTMTSSAFFQNYIFSLYAR